VDAADSLEREPMSPPLGRRRGLTMIEVLLLILLALIALGLLLVALNAGREQSRRLNCAYNLKQMGEAIIAFHESKTPHYLPAARIADRYATWAVQIAPFLPLKAEENPLKGWDIQQSYYAQPAEVRTAQVPLYYCPARRAPPENSVRGDVPTDGQPSRNHFPGALGDYACAAGDGDPAHPWQTDEANGALILGEVLQRQGDRILRWRGRTSLEKLPRGKSVTILVGEKHVPLGTFGETEQGDGSLYNGDYPASSPRIGGPGYGLARSPADPFNNNFGSYHPGICQFLYADGHVDALTNSVSEDVLGRLLNRLD
jgi:prepilin-type processing-associated H-X9-DG protein